MTGFRDGKRAITVLQRLRERHRPLPAQFPANGLLMKIDIFPHIMPRAYFDRLQEVAPATGHLMGRMRNIPVLFDLDARFAIMDRHEGYAQVLTLASPAIEEVAGPEQAAALARLANDEMAALVRRYPERFVGFAASLPMNNSEATLAEIERAIGDLGAVGVQIYTSVNGRPLDDPEFGALFSRMAELDHHPSLRRNGPVLRRSCWPRSGPVGLENRRSGRPGRARPSEPATA